MKQLITVLVTCAFLFSSAAPASADNSKNKEDNGKSESTGPDGAPGNSDHSNGGSGKGVSEQAVAESSGNGNVANGGSNGNAGNGKSDDNKSGDGRGNKTQYAAPWSDGKSKGAADSKSGGNRGTATGIARGNSKIDVKRLDQDQALQAVADGLALPLADIVKIAEGVPGVRVIDARLMHVQSILVYRLTLLNEEGVTKRVFYYARSGNPVRFD